jgi:hypothetical protein
MLFYTVHCGSMGFTVRSAFINLNDHDGANSAYFVLVSGGLNTQRVPYGM